MPVFFSDKGGLSEPEKVHFADPNYEQVAIGKPLYVEILHVAFGDTRDMFGKAEVLVSSWARLGGAGRSGPRLINVMRTGVDEFDHLSSFGAAEYANPLVFYTPNYNGERLHLSIEMLEIDKLRADGVKRLGEALSGLSQLTVFASELAFMSLAPEVLGLGRKLYNLLNRNDQVLLERLDLAFNEPDLKVLTSGRFVLVHKEQSASAILKKFKLSAGSELVTSDGRPAEEAGMKSPYVVIRINAKEMPEYRDFEIDSAAQDELRKFLNGVVTDELAEFVRSGVRDTANLNAVLKLMRLKKELDGTHDDGRRRAIVQEAQNEMRRLPDELNNLVLSVLAAPANAA